MLRGLSAEQLLVGFFVVTIAVAAVLGELGEWLTSKDRRRK